MIRIVTCFDLKIITIYTVQEKYLAMDIDSEEVESHSSEIDTSSIGS